MKRIANNVAFETIGYTLHGSQKLKVGFYDYHKVKGSNYNDYAAGFTKVLYEGDFMGTVGKGWLQTKVDFIQTIAQQNPATNLIETVLLVGLNEVDFYNN